MKHTKHLSLALALIMLLSVFVTPQNAFAEEIDTSSFPEIKSGEQMYVNGEYSEYLKFIAPDDGVLLYSKVEEGSGGGTVYNSSWEEVSSLGSMIDGNGQSYLVRKNETYYIFGNGEIIDGDYTGSSELLVTIRFTALSDIPELSTDTPYKEDYQSDDNAFFYRYTAEEDESIIFNAKMMDDDYLICYLFNSEFEQLNYTSSSYLIQKVSRGATYIFATNMQTEYVCAEKRYTDITDGEHKTIPVYGETDNRNQYRWFRYTATADGNLSYGTNRNREELYPPMTFTLCDLEGEAIGDNNVTAGESYYIKVAYKNTDGALMNVEFWVNFSEGQITPTEPTEPQPTIAPTEPEPTEPQPTTEPTSTETLPETEKGYTLRLVGNNSTIDTEDNRIPQISENVYQKTFLNVTPDWYTTIINYNGDWKEFLSYKFLVTDNCDVTVMLDTEKNEVTVNGDTVITDYSIEAGWYAVGDSGLFTSNWNLDLPLENAKMSYKNGTYYTIYTNVPAGYYEFKVAEFNEQGESIVWHPDGLCDSSYVNVENNGSTVLIYLHPTDNNSNDRAEALVFEADEEVTADFLKDATKPSESTTPSESNVTEPSESTTPSESDVTDPSKPSTPSESKETEPTTKTTVKKVNPVKVTAKQKTATSKKLKKSKVTVKPLTIKNPKGTVKVVKVKSGTTAKIYSKITVNKKTGAITLKKGKYKKGVYKIKLKISVKGNSKYKAKKLSKVVKIKIK